MTRIRNMKRPQLATILAGLALFVALGGTAAAAGGLINGKKIKKGTITAKQIKNKTITTGKIAPSTVSALSGQQGPRGPKGETGAAGKQGIQGIQGVPGTPGDSPLITYFEHDSSANNIPANQSAEVINMNGLDKGRYIITANVQTFTSGAGTIQCDLDTNGQGLGAEGRWTAPANGRNVIALSRITDTDQVTQLDVHCESSGANSAYAVDVSAVKTTP